MGFINGSMHTMEVRLVRASSSNLFEALYLAVAHGDKRESTACLECADP
jgi:hypothetical protein